MKEFYSPKIFSRSPERQSI